MRQTLRARLVPYGIAVVAPAVTLLVRWPLEVVLGDRVLYMAFFPAVLLAAFFGGLWPGLLATVLSALAATYFLVHPLHSLEITTVPDALALTLFVLWGIVISVLSESRLRSHRCLAASERRYAVTLGSIGDAVIATDARVRVTFLNPVAEALTGWPLADAVGRPLTEVFRIVNEQTRQPVEDPAAKVLRVGTVVGLANHTALVTRDGHEVPIDDCGAPIIDDRAAITGVVLIFRDVTQRRRAEETEAFRRANERMELAVRGSNVGVWDIETPDGDPLRGRHHYVNFWEQLGYEGPPAGRESARDEVYPDDRAGIEEAARRYLAGETAEFERETRFRHKDGSYRTMLARAAAVRDAAGRPVRLVGVIIDITKVKRAEEALRASEARFRALVQNSSDTISLFDAEGTVLYQSPSIERLLGYRSLDRIGRNVFSDPIVHPDDLAAKRLFFETALSRPGTPVTAEFRLRHADGSCRDIEAIAQNFLHDPGVAGIVANYRDVSDRKRAEEALRDSEQRWRSLTEALPQLVWSATPDGACDYFSTQWTEHTGVAEADLLGWQWLQTLHPDDRERTRRFWLESVAGRHPYDVEYRVRRRDGMHRWFKTRGTPIRDDGGNIVKWFGTCTDITDLRQTEEALRQSEERFRGTFENAAVGIAHVDVTGRFLRVNQKLCEIVGYTHEELLAKTFQDITHPDDVEADLDQFMRLVRGDVPSVARDKRYVRKDGSSVWVAVTVSLQRDAAGRPLNSISVIRDVTARKRLEGELRGAKEVAESANRAKDEFLANVSHEIRTPMNAILGMTELTLETPLTEDQRQSLKTVKSAGDNLLGIINDLLDFSKIEAGKLELDPADFGLRAAIGDTLRALAVRAHSKGLELVCQVQPDVPDALVGDVGRLRQVLLNLIDNAVKFTAQGEVALQVRLDIGPMGRMGPIPDVREALLHFTVRDTGIGIPLDKRATIFRAFEQEDTSTTRKYGGTGLGLTIAARLVALMGGQITVESEPGKGSAFAFTARFKLQRQQPNLVPAGPPVVLRNLPVLIVDDNATNRRILEEWLNGWHMAPATAGDSVAAMDILWHSAASGRPYALVLLDARMPDIDGLALAAMIRKRAALSATRIILLTSGDRPGDLSRARALALEAHLLKPVQQEELLQTIYRVMSRQAVSGELVSGGVASGEWSAATVAPLTTHNSPLPSDTRHSPRTASLRILVAEDNDFNAQHLEQLLIRRGHRVRLATNGREALALLGITGQESGVSSQESEVTSRQERPGSALTADPWPLTPDFDLLLLDIHMPELDGFQVVRAIRERERTGGTHLPVIALTARSRREDRERCLAAGMDGFLAKPIRSDDLWAAIDRIISKRRGASDDEMTAPGVACSPSPSEASTSLLAPDVLLSASGDDPVILRRICQALQVRLPEQLAALQDALRGQDAPRLREAAHRFCGIVAAFSTVAASVASRIEDDAAGGHLERCRPLIEELETITPELIRQATGVSIEMLRHPETVPDPKPADVS